MIRVGINGFGRIGRQVFRAIEQGGFEDILSVIAVNILTETGTHLLKHDSTYGPFDADVTRNGLGMVVNGRQVHAIDERDPSRLPWRKLGVDLVIEATGRFNHADHAIRHIQAGASRVIITAPARAEDITIVMGVNDDDYDPDHHYIISNASCTTNCLAPVAKVINDTFGIENGMMTTIHSYTTDQELLDAPHYDLRRSRSAALNIVPTSSGAARALSIVIPELEGKFDGFALRVPSPTVSIVDFVATTTRPASIETVNAAFRAASESKEMSGILGFSDEALVSMDYKHDSRSSIIDGLSTMVQGENMVKVVAWYDNEWGYSCRVADLAAMICRRGID